MGLDEFETKVMQGIDGIMFKGDASHKVTKLIYVNTDEKVYHGLYTLMNEFGEVIGWWFIRTGKMEELEDSIRKLKRRYEIHNFDRPEVIYSDRPEMDRSTWERIWPSLRPEAEASQFKRSSTDHFRFGSEYLTFPDEEKIPTVIYKAEECSAIINRIRECLDLNGGKKVLGFDLEWNKGRNPVATIQLSLISGLSFVFSLKGILGKRYLFL
jgi:transposase